MTTWTVYAHVENDGSVIYVGCTSRFDQRQREHAKRSPWWPQVAQVTVVGTWRVKRAALDAERWLIGELNPANNLLRSEREHDYYSRAFRAARARKAVAA